MISFLLSLLISLYVNAVGVENMPEATFAAGCFWGVEAAFRDVDGVTATRAGYTGGRVKNPTYEEVCTGITGHAEAVEIEYDSLKVSYEDLLAVFFKIHDPTTLNRQGPDIGNQYRSAIFFRDEQQKQAAEKYIRRLEESGKYRDSIVTEIKKYEVFYPAEEYHQRYLEKHGRVSCGINLKKDSNR